MKRKLLLIGILIWSFNAVFGQTSGIPKRLPPPGHPAPPAPPVPPVPPVPPAPPVPPVPPVPPREIPNPLAQHLTCGTPHPANPTIYRQETDGGRLSSSDSNDVLCINVFFHIARHSDGSEPEGFTTPDLNSITVKLNQYYNPHNIIINNAGSQFIDDDDLVKIDTPEFNEEVNNQTFTNAHGIDNAINYFIVNKIDSYLGFVIAIPSTSLFIISSEVLTTTSPHEVGHCLGLYHTHYKPRTEATNCQGCNKCGDMVCDTPVDPNLHELVSSDCTYDDNLGGGRDNLGVGYDPLTNNIMSYSSEDCRDSLTPGQVDRIRNAIVDPLLGITGNSCTTISQMDLLCLPETRTVCLTNVGSATTTWTSSSNVLITSSANTKATFRALNLSRLPGDSWIRATLNNGLEFTETFDVYHAFNSNNISLSASSSYTLNDSRWNTVDAHYNGSLYWDQNHTWEWQVPESFVKQSWESHSFIHVRPNTRAPSIYIQVRGCNDECGCSDWKGRWFRVRQSNSSGSGSGSSSEDDIIEY